MNIPRLSPGLIRGNFFAAHVGSTSRRAVFAQQALTIVPVGGGALARSAWDPAQCYKDCIHSDHIPLDCWNCCYLRKGNCAPDVNMIPVAVAA